VPPNKATFFFCNHYDKGIPWYEGFFSRPWRARAVGEVCHDYLASPEAMRRIREYRPDMRLICCLRNPYERALSMWRFFGRNGVDQPTLVAQAADDPGVFGQGNYATQLAYLRSIFGENQVLVFFFEELASDPASVARRLYEFIGVNPNFTPPSLSKRVNVNAKPRSRLLARLVLHVPGQSWNGSLIFSNLVGRIKRIKPLRRMVRAALYKERRDTHDWREHLGDFPSHVISQYEREIHALEMMFEKNLSNWHAPTNENQTKSADDQDEGGAAEAAGPELGRIRAASPLKAERTGSLQGLMPSDSIES
jgi:hypothetical protein